MIIAPKALTDNVLAKTELATDKRNCLRSGPCGIGEKALYLNSFYIDRIFYVKYEDIDRVFKRVAMSKGGFTGKGIFGSIPYLVVQLKNGKEKQCNFKIENDVDALLHRIEIDHPEIPTHSKEAEERLRKAEEEERKKYLKELTPEAAKSVEKLERAEKFLKLQPEKSDRLAFSAKQKRTLDSISPTYRLIAILILLAGLASAVWGITSWINHTADGAVYFVLFGFAAILFAMASRVLPSGTRNKKYGEEQWEKALATQEAHIKTYEGFPVPAYYAHPIVMERLMRAIKMGRAITIDEAMQVVKDDLKALNPSVTVTQKEYDEVVVVKPLFALMEYK
ncbi:MAG: NnrS family protein [Lachnospiraceae bacterium]|nr:NnrS family protein [Lachnospiraceae bacterium]